MIVLALLCLTAPVAKATAPNHVVAQVGQLMISKQEMRQAGQKILPFNVNLHGKLSKEKVEDIRRQALDGLAERALKIQYALEREIAVGNAAVTAKLDEIRGRFESEEDFQKAAGGQALAALKAGEIGGRVNTVYGNHIIKLDKVKNARQLTFEGVRGKLKQPLE